MKITKSSGFHGQNTPAIRRSGPNVWLNAASRNVLGDPDYISIEYSEKEHVVILAASTDAEDYKVTKTYSGRSFSCTPLIKILKIQPNERRSLRIDGNRLILDAKTEGVM